MRGGAGPGLRGRKILVVEDEYVIADEIACALRAVGAEVVGPTATVAEALPLATGGEGLHGAVLDVNLGGERVWPVADVLLARGVPVVLATGYDREAIPPPYLRLPRREKPVTIADLTGALVERMGLRDDCRPPRPMARGRRK